MLETKRAAPGRRPARWLGWFLMSLGLVLIALAAGGLLLTQFQAARPRAVAGPARVGQPLADFALTDLNGSTVRLSDYAGRPVLINLWATWCPPCRAEMPTLETYYRQQQAEGFVLLAVNVGESPRLARAFAVEYGLSFPVLFDSDKQLADLLQVRNYPTSIMIGRDGLVKAVHTGLLSPEQLRRLMDPLVEVR